MIREYLDYFDDIIEAMRNATQFIEGLEYADFTKDTKTVYAVVRALEIIGEAVTKIPDEIKNRYPEIPWKDIAGMRNKLVHEYFGVDTEVVWDTVKQDIPALRPLIEKIKKDFPNK